VLKRSRNAAEVHAVQTNLTQRTHRTRLTRWQRNTLAFAVGFGLPMLMLVASVR
jgi:hypothetical protein